MDCRSKEVTVAPVARACVCVLLSVAFIIRVLGDSYPSALLAYSFGQWTWTSDIG